MRKYGVGSVNVVGGHGVGGAVVKFVSRLHNGGNNDQRRLRNFFMDVEEKGIKLLAKTLQMPRCSQCCTV